MAIRIIQVSEQPVEVQKAFNLVNRNFVAAKVWNDAQAPAFGTVLGASAPSDVILSTANPADATMDIHTLGFNENTEDRVYCSIQFPHDIYIPESGNIILAPHVHWSFISEPDSDLTVIFKLAYVYAAHNAQFAAAPTILTSETYTTGATAEIRKHLTSRFANVSIPVADIGPSTIIMSTLKLDTTSTISNGVVCVLSIDWHYQKGPLGTNAEYGE